ncbi:unnamed protein product [Prorocentrum cordatum]|uniref:Uncharacterized protein n=1 Tax=Prorocentrum cordatum TaxID=2364126 RepID=A0ABN9SJK3_9DINO|nr:unnamed protein product [Polarella glacialis]
MSQGPSQVELCCKGANLTRIFLTFCKTQSPFVEIELDGKLIDRTKPDEDGNKMPRWNKRVLINTDGRMLVFRVKVVGSFDNKLCGEGHIDLRKCLKDQKDEFAVPLKKDGESTGFLAFSIRPLGARPLNGGNAQAQAQMQAQNHAQSGYPQPQAPPASYPATPAASHLPHEQAQMPQAQAGAHAQTHYGDGGQSQPQASPPGWAPQAPRAGPGMAAAPLPPQPHAGGAYAHNHHGHTGQLQPQAPPAGWMPQAPHSNPAMVAAPVSPSVQAQAPQQLPLPARPPAQPTTNEAAHAGQASQVKVGSRGQQAANELMQSKDRMREYADRPFKSLQGREELNLAEFQTAINQLCADFEMANPGERGIAKMFQKHSGGEGKGVNREDFEALMFRLLCFLLAEGDVSISKTKPKGGEARDAQWREEFLKTNKQAITEVYDFGKKLGEGAFGAVYMAYHKTELQGTSRRQRVAKVISKASAVKNGTPHEKVREEFAVLKRLDHPHVLRIFEDFEDDTNFYIVLEPCRGGDLQEAVAKPHTSDPHEWERWVAKALQHTLEAVAYCHGRGVIHKDLKPDNVMMASPKGAPVQDLHIVVVDFGLAQMFGSPTDRSNEIAGTPPFMAPEVWKGNFGKACDVWACGVMLFYMLSGTYPFMASRLEDFPRAVAMEPDWSRIAGASPEAQWMCAAMLIKDERTRPFAQQLLQQQWFATPDLAGPGGGDMLSNTVRVGIMSVQERSDFEKFVGRLVATQLDAGQLKKVNEAFRTFDKDRDGTLSREELVHGLMTLGATQADALKVVDGMDVGKTGQISQPGKPNPQGQ